MNPKRNLDRSLHWVEGQPLAFGPCPPGGEMLLPRCREMRFLGVDMVVSAQTESEARSLGLSGEEGACQEAGIDFLRIPIQDHSAPPYTKAVFDGITQMVEAIKAGKKIYIHCFAGIGRSATLAAAVLLHQDYSAEEAIRALRKARGLSVPETQEQIMWILDYAERQMS